MTPLVDNAQAIDWLVAVRGNGSVIHLVARDKDFGPTHGTRALCGQHGYTDGFGRLRWTRVRAAGKTHCQACFTASLATSRTTMRVDWG